MDTTANERFYDGLNADEAVMVDNVLFPVEQLLLSSLRNDIENKTVLEIGIGSGRVTSHLRRLTPYYTGVDRSSTMISIARASYPEASFYVCDAANMAIFDSGAFDAIFFCWNGIDEVSHSSRLQILCEVERLLRANGIFVFSAHNLAWRGIPSYAWPRLSRSSKPLVWIWDNLVRVSSYAGIVFKAALARVSATGRTSLWEYENMPPPMLVPRVYVKPESQIRQLRRVGFRHIDALTADGSSLTNDNRGDGYFVYYVARK